jgi:excisionase family DNA binding protein
VHRTRPANAESAPSTKRIKDAVLFTAEDGKIHYLRRYVSKDEAAHYLGISAGTFIMLINTGKLVLTKISLGKRRVVYDVLEIDRCMAAGLQTPSK